MNQLDHSEFAMPSSESKPGQEGGRISRRRKKSESGEVDVVQLSGGEKEMMALEQVYIMR